MLQRKFWYFLVASMIKWTSPFSRLNSIRTNSLSHEPSLFLKTHFYDYFIFTQLNNMSLVGTKHLNYRTFRCFVPQHEFALSASLCERGNTVSEPLTTIFCAFALIAESAIINTV